MSIALNMMGWREILARVMDGFEFQENVSPDWLVNPATHRRLKLDLLYPEAGLAIRFVGLTAKGQPRRSEWEQLEEEQRDQTRAELCRLNGVELLLLDPGYPDPREQLRKLRTSLSRASRLLAQGKHPDRAKATIMPRLAEARKRLDQVSLRIKRPEDLALFAELWRDRETAAVAATRQPRHAPAKRARKRSYKPGEQVVHSHFGPGTVMSVNGGADDPQVTIQFADGSERTFLASLVAGKLSNR